MLDKNALVKSGSRNIQYTNTNVRVNGFAAGFAAENKGIIQDACSGGTVWGSQLYSAGLWWSISTLTEQLSICCYQHFNVGQ